MTGDDAGRPRPLPVDSYPDPVLVYGGDGEPTVRNVNGAFRSAFGDLPAGAPLADGFDRVGIVPIATEDVASRVAAGDRFGVRVEGSDERPRPRYLATPVPDAEGDGGHVVFATAEPPERCELGVDRMASVVSHDLRNPLEVAKTRLRAGRETGDDEHFDHVAKAHDRMERIIEDVLTLARGEDAIDPAGAVDLTAVAEAAWESVDTDGAALTVDTPLPTAVADPDRTGRVFENLFRNAIEHGGSSVTVGELEDGFYVADDGPGIPEDEREAVFEPGYSSHDHGTGLGLAIVDRIARAHGWTATVTASAAGGTRVEVRDL